MPSSLAPAVAALLSALAPTPPAVAAGPLAVTTRIMAEQPITAADGTTRFRLVAPGKVVPGDRLTVVVGYRNTGNQPIDGLVLANPVPPGLAYGGAAPDGAVPELSVDGRRFGPLSDLSVGTGAARRAATAADVTQVRWRLPTTLAAGAGGERAFRAVVR